MTVLHGRVAGFDQRYYAIDVPEAPAHLRTLFLLPSQMNGAVIGSHVTLEYQVTRNTGLWNVVAVTAKSDFTPGPWHFMTDTTGEYLAVYAKPQGGTKVICPVKIADEADAKLIAAAPELLAALKALLAGRPELWGDEVVNGVTDFPIDEDALFAADSAIKKAEGR